MASFVCRQPLAHCSLAGLDVAGGPPLRRDWIHFRPWKQPTEDIPSADAAGCEDVGIEAYIARPQRGSAVRDGLFGKEEFRYDPTSDTHLCPGGQQLYPLYRCSKGDHTTVQYCNRDACRGGELKPQCTANTSRRIGRWTEEAVLDRMVARLAARPEISEAAARNRRAPVRQHQAMDQPGYLSPAWAGEVRAEFSLTALAYTFIRVVNIVGVATLLKAV